jgi:hypothetical protein
LGGQGKKKSGYLSCRQLISFDIVRRLNSTVNFQVFLFVLTLAITGNNAGPVSEVRLVGEHISTKPTGNTASLGADRDHALLFRDEPVSTEYGAPRRQIENYGVFSS